MNSRTVLLPTAMILAWVIPPWVAKEGISLNGHLFHRLSTRQFLKGNAAAGVLGIALGAARAKSDDPQVAVRGVLDTQVEAWNRGDVSAFMEGYWSSDATAFVSSTGIVRGWQAMLDRYRTAYPDRQAMGTLTFSDLEITVLSPAAALVMGRWQLQREHDKPGGVFTLVFRKLTQGWRIINDHTSAVSGQ